MRYRIQHTTTYTYHDPVPICQNLVMLAPRASLLVQCEHHQLQLLPQPRAIHRRADEFGNVVHGFSIEEPHQKLRISSTSQVSVASRALPVDATAPAWETVRDRVLDASDPQWMEAVPFVFDSPRITRAAMFADYANVSFPPQQPIAVAVRDLLQRLHADFQYDPEATSVSTSVEEAFEIRRGVCQDLAHVMIACLRSMGLAARYVSGYLRTVSHAGDRTLVGADQSHAWISFYAGEWGWLDFDPTNNCHCELDHIPIAWGRDYGDVIPIRGVFLGGGAHHMQVSVEVQSLSDVT